MEDQNRYFPMSYQLWLIVSQYFILSPGFWIVLTTAHQTTVDYSPYFYSTVSPITSISPNPLADNVDTIPIVTQVYELQFHRLGIVTSLTFQRK